MRPVTGVRTPAQRLGDAAETHAAEALKAQGWTILGRHVRLGRSELDLLAVAPGPPPELVIVEVRWRARRDHGYPEETIGHAKRAGLRVAVGRLAETRHLADGTSVPRLPIRIDVVAVEPGRTPETPVIRHHRHAI